MTMTLFGLYDEILSSIEELRKQTIQRHDSNTGSTKYYSENDVTILIYTNRDDVQIINGMQDLNLNALLYI